MAEKLWQRLTEAKIFGACTNAAKFSSKILTLKLPVTSSHANLLFTSHDVVSLWRRFSCHPHFAKGYFEHLHESSKFLTSFIRKRARTEWKLEFSWLQGTGDRDGETLVCSGYKWRNGDVREGCSDELRLHFDRNCTPIAPVFPSSTQKPLLPRSLL